MNKVVIVTGGANGIGKAISLQVANMGYTVLIVDLDPKQGKILAKELGNNSSYFNCDISDEESVIKLFKKIKTKYKQLFALINNAGIIRDNVIWKMPSEDFNAVMDINLKGTWLMCKYAVPFFKEQNFGRIVNIASRAWLGNPGQTNYSASKAGIIGLTRSLALETAKYNVLVNAVAPGLIDTPLTQKLPEDVRQKLIQAQPTKTIGKPGDVAHAVAFLINESTQFITGQTLYVDGGKSIGAGI